MRFLFFNLLPKILLMAMNPVRHFLALKPYRFSWNFLAKAGGLCLFWFLTFSASAQTHFKFTEGRKKQKLKFQLHRNLIIVQTKLNGKGPFNFLVDTGVSSSIITDAGLQDSLKFSRGPALEIAG